jgi:hypothetical protein
MIPLPGSWTAMRVLVVVLAAIALLGLGTWHGWNVANDSWTARWEKREADWQGKVLEEAQKARAIEAKANQDVAKLRDDHAARMDVLGADLDSALGQLRRERTRAALKPASAAPAPCRDFEASPAQLSQSDAEFLVRFAAEADGVAIKLGTCQRYITAVHDALTGATDDGTKH